LLLPTLFTACYIGFVLDFVGIFEKLERALAFDSDVVGSVIQNIDVLKQLFATMMQEATREYLPWTRGWNDKACQVPSPLDS
jgi:type I restriction enzyme R subunit